MAEDPVLDEPPTLRPFAGVDPRSFSYLSRKHREILDILHREAVGKVVLDVGCGPNPLGSITLDMDPANTKADYICDLNSERIPLPDRSVDFVVLSDVLEHLRAPGHALAESVRVLRLGGKVIITIPNSGHPLFRLGLWRQRVKTGPPHVQFWTRAGFQEFLRSHGLSVERFLPTYYFVGHRGLMRLFPSLAFCLLFVARRSNSPEGSPRASE